MDSTRRTVSYEGHDYHDWNDHVDESPQHLPSSVQMLEENVPLHDQPGRTNSRHYSDSEKIGSSLKGLDNINHDCPWRPGGFRRFPYLGYIPLLLSMACTGLAICIILGNDGELVSDRSGRDQAQPALLLALTSTAANTLMMIAYFQGWVSFFWIQALKGNMPLSNLHYNWEAATSIWGSLKSLMRRRALRVSVVSILVAMTSSLRGPLIQQGSYVLTREVSLPGTIALQVLNTTEAWDSISSDTPKFKRIFSDVMREYQARTPIYMPGQDCTNCSLSVQGFGFDYVKTTDLSNSYQFFKRPPTSGTHDTNGTFTNTAIFNVTTRAIDDTKYIEVGITRKASNSCDAELFTTVHRLYPSTVMYDLFLKGQKATFLTNSTWRDDNVVQQLNLPPTAGGHKNWKLNYFGQIADHFWGAATYLTVAWGDISIDEPKGKWMTWNFNIPDPDDPEHTIRSWIDYEGATSFLYEQIPGDQSPCGPSFDDPTDDILNGFRELALRLSIREAIEKNKAAAAAGNGTEENLAFVQEVDYKSHQLRTEYAVNTPVLSLAVFFSLLGPIAIFFLFQDWHTLGRNFSFSPFELANSLLLRSSLPSSSSRSSSSGDSIFELKQRQHQLASLLASCSSNASAEKLVESIRQMAGAGSTGSKEPVVQYGVLDGTGLLGFAISDANGVVHARKPRKGEML